MALPPTIPTSFVPYAATGGTARRFRADFGSAFGYFAYAVLGISVILAIGVFAYGRILSAEKNSKDAALADAEKSIDQATVEDFVRLRNRLISSKNLLGNHVAFSGLFDLLENILPATARMTSLHLALDNSGSIKFEGAGVAKSFNALAAVSTAFSKDGRIKDAIFSNIVVSPKDSSVSFKVSAFLDPALVAFSASGALPASTGSVDAPSAPVGATAPVSSDATTTTATTTAKKTP